jgi:biotin carboxyl carrier protein
MKYTVSVDGHAYVVEIEGNSVTVEGQPVAVELTEIDGTPTHVLAVGDTRLVVTARPQPGHGRYTLWTDRYRFDVEAIDERTRVTREFAAMKAAAAGPAPLVAPMPGLIVRVNVSPGDHVQAGQGLVVMEAMKMENELRAAGNGTVSAVRVTPGKAVEKGTVLVELE